MSATPDTDTDIKSLEARLAAWTKPCPAIIGNDFWQIHLSEYLINQSCADCNGTGVVPMIAGSRRKCSVYVGETGNCDNCNDLGYTPDLSMQKVEEFMLRSGNIVTTLYQDEAIYEVLWLLRDPPDTIHDMFAKSDDLYIAKMTVCLAGIEAKA